MQAAYSFKVVIILLFFNLGSKVTFACTTERENELKWYFAMNCRWMGTISDEGKCSADNRCDTEYPFQLLSSNTGRAYFNAFTRDNATLASWFPIYRTNSTLVTTAFDYLRLDDLMLSGFGAECRTIFSPGKKHLCCTQLPPMPADWSKAHLVYLKEFYQQKCVWHGGRWLYCHGGCHDDGDEAHPHEILKAKSTDEWTWRHADQLDGRLLPERRADGQEARLSDVLPTMDGECRIGGHAVLCCSEWPSRILTSQPHVNHDSHDDRKKFDRFHQLRDFYHSTQCRWQKTAVSITRTLNCPIHSVNCQSGQKEILWTIDGVAFQSGYDLGRIMPEFNPGRSKPSLKQLLKHSVFSTALCTQKYCCDTDPPPEAD